MYIQCLSACSSHMTNGCYAYACSGGKYKLQFFIHQHRCPWIPGPWSVLMGLWESILSHSMLNRCRNRAGAEGHRGQVPPTNFQIIAECMFLYLVSISQPAYGNQYICCICLNLYSVSYLCVYLYIPTGLWWTLNFELRMVSISVLLLQQEQKHLVPIELTEYCE